MSRQIAFYQITLNPMESVVYGDSRSFFKVLAKTVALFALSLYSHFNGWGRRLPAEKGDTEMNRYRFDEDGNPLMNKSVGTHPRERDYDDNLRDDYAAAIDLGLTPEEISSIEFNSCVRVGLIPASNSPADTSQPVEGICLKWTEEERGTSGHHRGLHGMGFEDSPVCVLQQGEWRWASLVMGSDGPRKDPQRLGSLDSNFEDMKSVWAGAGKEWPELGVVDSVYFSCPTLIDGKGFTILAMGHYSINRW